MTDPKSQRYVSRGGDKLAAALNHFDLDPTGLSCADLGSHVGGFVDCLLQHRAARVYSVDTSYGILAWKLRKDSRVVVFERTNAMHVALPEKVGLLTVDVGWTRQEKIIPHAATLISDQGIILTLVKPHYEARDDERVDGVVLPNAFDAIVARTVAAIAGLGMRVEATCESPIPGHGGNREVFALLRRS